MKFFRRKSQQGPPMPDPGPVSSVEDSRSTEAASSTIATNDSALLDQIMAEIAQHEMKSRNDRPALPIQSSISSSSDGRPRIIPGPSKSSEKSSNDEGNYVAMNDDELVHIPSTEPTQSWYWFSFFRRPASSTKHLGDGIMTNENDGGHSNSWIRRLSLFLCSSSFLYLVIFVGMATGLVYGAARQYGMLSKIDWDEQISVAFIGSSSLFVNDVPRVLETVAAGQIIQDSCLHSGGSLAFLLMAGNGMWNKWQTENAVISQADDDAAEDDQTSGYSSSSYATLYDYGACSVHMLLQGYDEYIQYGNGNKAYYNEGTNPCILDENYLEYATTKYARYPAWDYVVLADQSKRMASDSARYDTVDALVSVYAPLIEQAGSIPVIVDTNAFWSTQTNMTGLSDIPTFTRMIYEGVEVYVQALAGELPEEQAPIIVPIGLAYLTIWEEDYDLWTKLFLSDGMHASLHGTYLFANVLYTTLFNHLPKKSATVQDHVEFLFASSRKIIGQTFSYPSKQEASYLRNIAKRVVLDGHVPKSFTADSSSTSSFSTDDYTTDDEYRRHGRRRRKR